MTSTEIKRWRMLAWKPIQFVLFEEGLSLFSYHLAYDISLKKRGSYGYANSSWRFQMNLINENRVQSSLNCGEVLLYPLHFLNKCV